MIYRIAADFVVVIHLAFILFAVAGGLLVLRWRRLLLVHIPAFGWAILISFAGWVCPLTPLENWLRQQGGEAGYNTSFIEHYLLPLIYPTALTRGLQIFLGLFVLIVNLSIYSWLIFRRQR
ncbi:DUF2784 domain-containing protein [Capilliphycus salinus ALCB114379]|uniref:DUF2784 domain-containing protein n=1 Tax=Capilliphycus salinus TaxID=2768948 RepID=UPI0039A644A9